MTFTGWKETKEYKELIDIFGNYGYVEAIAEFSYNAGQKNKIDYEPTNLHEVPATIY